MLSAVRPSRKSRPRCAIGGGRSPPSTWRVTRTRAPRPAPRSPRSRSSPASTRRCPCARRAGLQGLSRRVQRAEGEPGLRRARRRDALRHRRAPAIGRRGGAVLGCVRGGEREGLHDERHRARRRQRGSEGGAARRERVRRGVRARRAKRMREPRAHGGRGSRDLPRRGGSPSRKYIPGLQMSPLYPFSNPSDTWTKHSRTSLRGVRSTPRSRKSRETSRQPMPLMLSPGTVPP